MEHSDNNNTLLTFLMHEVYTSINSCKVKLNELASQKIIQNSDYLLDNILEVQSYIDQIDMLMKYVDIKQNPNSLENLLDSEPLDINLLSTFQNPNQYFRKLMKVKRLKYNVVVSDNIPLIKGYPILRSIVNIMLDNAVKYSPNDSDIECMLDSSSNELLIVMQNEGPYVEPSEIKDIPKQGFRGENAISTGRRGHGFGLDFLTEIVENIHFGKLHFNSAFKFQLNNVKYGTFECKIILPIKLG